jgi:hypothetical protein
MVEASGRRRRPSRTPTTLGLNANRVGSRNRYAQLQHPLAPASRADLCWVQSFRARRLPARGPGPAHVTKVYWRETLIDEVDTPGLCHCPAARRVRFRSQQFQSPTRFARRALHLRRGTKRHEPCGTARFIGSLRHLGQSGDKRASIQLLVFGDPAGPSRPRSPAVAQAPT